MPAPMIAPTPSAVSWKGPSVRFRLCPPSSLASESNKLIGFLANKGLPMQLLLCGCRLAETIRCQIGLRYCRGTPGFSLQQIFYAAAPDFAPERDHSRYTGTPSITITNPGHAVCV